MVKNKTVIRIDEIMRMMKMMRITMVKAPAQTKQLLRSQIVKA